MVNYGLMIDFKEVTILAIFCLLKNECYLHGKFDIEGKSDIKVQ